MIDSSRHVISWVQVHVFMSCDATNFVASPIARSMTKSHPQQQMTEIAAPVVEIKAPLSFHELDPDTKNAIKAVFQWFRTQSNELKSSAPTTLERRQFLEVLADLEDNETVAFAAGATRKVRAFLKNGSCPGLDRVFTDEIYQPDSDAKSDGEKQFQFVVWRGSLDQGEVDLFCVTRDDMRASFAGLDADSGQIKGTSFRLTPAQWRDVYRLIRSETDPSDYKAYARQLVRENLSEGNNNMWNTGWEPPAEVDESETPEQKQERKQIDEALAASLGAATVATPTPSGFSSASQGAAMALPSPGVLFHRQNLLRHAPRAELAEYIVSGEDFRALVQRTPGGLAGLAHKDHDTKGRTMQDTLVELITVRWDSVATFAFCVLVVPTQFGALTLTSWTQIGALITGNRVADQPVLEVTRALTFDDDIPVPRDGLLLFIEQVALADVHMVYETFRIPARFLPENGMDSSFWGPMMDAEGNVIEYERTKPVWRSFDRRWGLFQASQRIIGIYVVASWSKPEFDFSHGTLNISVGSASITSAGGVDGTLSLSLVDNLDPGAGRDFDLKIALDALETFPTSPLTDRYRNVKRLVVRLRMKPFLDVRERLVELHYVATDSSELEWTHAYPYVAASTSEIKSEVKSEIKAISTPTPSAFDGASAQQQAVDPRLALFSLKMDKDIREHSISGRSMHFTLTPARVRSFYNSTTGYTDGELAIRRMLEMAVDRRSPSLPQDFYFLTTGSEASELKSYKDIAAAILGRNIQGRNIYLIDRAATFAPDLEVPLPLFLSLVSEVALQSQIAERKSGVARYNTFAISRPLVSDSAARNAEGAFTDFWEPTATAWVRKTPLVTIDELSELYPIKQQEGFQEFVLASYGNPESTSNWISGFEAKTSHGGQEMIVRNPNVIHVGMEDPDVRRRKLEIRAVLLAIDMLPTSQVSTEYANVEEIRVMLLEAPDADWKEQLEVFHFVPITADKKQWSHAYPWATGEDQTTAVAGERKTPPSTSGARARASTETGAGAGVGGRGRAGAAGFSSRSSRSSVSAYSQQAAAAVVPRSGMRVERKTAARVESKRPRAEVVSSLRQASARHVDESEDLDVVSEDFSDRDIALLLAMSTISPELRADLVRIKESRARAMARSRARFA
jgi:ribosomal protein L15